ncbi:hypothetical protein FSARC_11948 [Fusarium sarcochroum]|uniref:Uncharacterized protein n=1 Tax=Fusarium sarcochroum TaxID=1208366 RepID=A0A8H4TBX5_9HYPO|nr:hypothetical protein FSARC_11948 [Fusarium sarcochroum]
MSGQQIPPELPLCDGPKLHMFKFHGSRIHWQERLDDGATSSKGHVFRAVVRGRTYAIKVFRFFDPAGTECFWDPLLGKGTPPDTAAYYTDPFYAECRAYGRIRDTLEKKRKHRVAAAVVPCHGFLFLSPKDQQALERRGIDLRPQDGINFTPRDVNVDYQKSAIGGFRARAIVKDVWSSDSGVHTANLKKILDDIVSMNAIGIYNMDIRLDSFCDARIIEKCLMIW